MVGLAADSSNRLLVSASLDGHLRIWRFKALTQQADVALGAPATHLAMHPGSALAAVALDSRQVVMYDVEAARLVRRFKGHGDRITALSISEDSRWVQRLAVVQVLMPGAVAKGGAGADARSCGQGWCRC